MKKLSLFAYCFVVLNIIVISSLLMFRTSVFFKLVQEDSFVEYFGFIFLLATSIALFATCYQYFRRSQLNKTLAAVFLIAGIIFFWASGEEISWGQRIFKIDTPSILVQVNQQDELNLHNINKKFFDRGVKHLTTLLILGSSLLFFLKKDRIWGIKVPDTFLVYSFVLLPAYSLYSHISFGNYIGYIVIVPYFIYFLIKNNKKMLLATVSVVGVIIFVTTIQVLCEHLFISRNEVNEVREYLFGMLCFFYSVNLFNDAKIINRF